MDPTTPGHSHRTAFLLSQLGSLAAAGFAERVREIGLTPGEAGILRLVDRNPGLSQRMLANRLGIVPSRIVPLIDALEDRGLMVRQRSSADRRNYELLLTSAGKASLRQLRGISAAYEEHLLMPLSDRQRRELTELLGVLAAGHGTDTELHRDTGS